MRTVGQIVGFNYDSVEEKHRARTREHAGEIQKLVERSAAAIVEIGQRLIEVHDALGSRHYQAWLKAEFRWRQATASNYESVARKFGDLDCLNRFNPSALTTLCRANVDPRIIKQAIKLARAGETITRDRVAKLMRKYLATPPVAAVAAMSDDTAVANAPARGALPGVLNAIATDLRSLVRRLDISAIPADQRGPLADELLELALRLRKESTAELVAPAIADAPAKPTRPANRRRPAETGALKCA